MTEHDPNLQPQQERSRRTLARLLSATIQTLNEGGLEGATIPRIADTAGVSPATVYRRFKDKQDLLRAAFLYMLESSNARNHIHLARELALPTLAEAVRRFLELHFAQYRQNGQLMGALRQFIQTDDDTQAIRDIVADNLDLVVQALLAYRDEISHPKPERALRIAILTATTAVETKFFAPRSAWATLQPLADEELMEELIRSFLAYLKSPG
ncbi:MAG: TetR/AcrR family transcriptional regulator [Gammaproteobacteria bacterium]